MSTTPVIEKKDIVRFLKALGYTASITNYDKAVRAFQKSNGLDIDGIVGVATAPLLRLAWEHATNPPAVKEITPVQLNSRRVVPLEWMPSCKMTGIVLHWTAGGHVATAFDRKHYHILINSDGTLVQGIPTIPMNASPLKTGYAQHTALHNTGIIGVSLCCMAQADDSPFDSGPSPMTRAQWDMAPYVLADLCRRYNIDITDKTVLSHAEVQPNLGIRQAGKWDITRLSFDLSIVGAKACGDLFRKRTTELLVTP